MLAVATELYSAKLRLDHELSCKGQTRPAVWEARVRLDHQLNLSCLACVVSRTFVRRRGRRGSQREHVSPGCPTPEHQTPRYTDHPQRLYTTSQSQDS